MVDLLTTIAGVVFALIAAVCFSLAGVFQKKGLMEGLPEIQFEEGIVSVLKSFKEFFNNKSWVLGFSLGAIGWFPYIISMGMVGILVTQPLMSIGLIIFVIAANKILGEKITFFEIVAIGMLGIAPILITSAGISDVRIDLYAFAIPFLIFFLIMVALIFLCFFMSKKKRGTEYEAIFIIFTGAIIYATGAVFTNILAQAIYDAKVFPLFFWEIMFGIFWFDYYHLWVFLAFWGMAIMNIISIAFVQSALQKGKAVLMIPILNSINLIIPILAGLLVFRQSFTNYYLFSIAIILILIATLTLSKFQAKIETIDVPQELNEEKIN